MLDLQERLELLEEARKAIYEAADLIEQAVWNTELEAFAASYVIPALKMAASRDHEYLGSQPANIDELIAGITEDMTREIDEDDEA